MGCGRIKKYYYRNQKTSRSLKNNMNWISCTGLVISILTLIPILIASFLWLHTKFVYYFFRHAKLIYVRLTPPKWDIKGASWYPEFWRIIPEEEWENPYYSINKIMSLPLTNVNHSLFILNWWYKKYLYLKKIESKFLRLQKGRKFMDTKGFTYDLNRTIDNSFMIGVVIKPLLNRVSHQGEPKKIKINQIKKELLRLLKDEYKYCVFLFWDTNLDDLTNYYAFHNYWKLVNEYKDIKSKWADKSGMFSYNNNFKIFKNENIFFKTINNPKISDSLNEAQKKVILMNKNLEQPNQNNNEYKG